MERMIDVGKLSEEALEHNMEANDALGKAFVEALETRRPVTFCFTYDFSDKNLPDDIYVEG